MAWSKKAATRAKVIPIVDQLFKKHQVDPAEVPAFYEAVIRRWTHFALCTKCNVNVCKKCMSTYMECLDTKAEYADQKLPIGLITTMSHPMIAEGAIR